MLIRICASAAVCAKEPEIFQMNDAGKAEAYADTTDENRDAVMEAIDGCPVGAIREEE